MSLVVMSRTRFRKTLVAVLATTVVWVGCAAAASAQPSTISVKKYGSTAVIRAFRASGIGLYNQGYGAVQPVTVFASTEAHQGWNVAVYIYLTPKAAAESYKGNIGAWRGAGMAAAVKKNVVVAVVPKQRVTIAKKAKPWPLPDLIVKTLASLPA
jgi:hypothetical protein